ncbi:tape measure protein [Mycobacteroides abscessus]|uniref:tape measure protein n=1 Tax=Mycobacteroides abscessus TaxID=36809 RepID=UPI00078C51A6|nr:tape measure protein [Mycobacteroides abscessus]AMU71428.1 hypothetical protein A3O05_16300 [Mycobacteroides abscessus]MDM2015265.1 tape measure protein [Mycobacteroides abscessus]MDM2019643.1 tape measure protein [Mycobacteroides abscessus]MDM2025148.1 tape measure protein [Mycobacteroides abscessus]MDM2027819.1 tape measure protein [Mycobacteroides abscessus]
MSEIETLWISLAVSGKNLKRDMDREVTGAGTQAGNKIAKELEDAAGKGAKRAAQQIDRNLGRSLGERTGAALGTALGVGLRPVVGTVQRLGGEAGRQWVQKFSQQLANAKVNAPKVNAPINVDLPGGGSGSSGGLATAGMLGAIARAAGPAAIALGVTGVAYKTLSAGFDRAKSLDATRFKLEALGNDATAVAQIMQAAQASVKGTAFSMDEAASTAATAVAAGVKPGEDLAKYLNTVADAAAIAGADLGDMGHIFNKVQTSGKAMTDDLNMLGDRGLPIFAWLQKEYKVTGAELSKMVEGGKVDAATFQRVISENVGGAAKKMGGTFEGSMKNMGAALGRLGEAIIAPFMGSGTDALGQITVAVDKLSGFVKEHQPEIIRFAAAVGTAFTSMAGSIARGLGDGLRFIAKFVDGIKTASSGIGGFFSALGLTDIGDALQRWGSDRSVNDWLRDTAKSVDEFGDRATAASDRIAKWGEDTAETTKIVNALGAAVQEVPDTHEIVLKDNSPEQIAKLNAIGYTVKQMPDGKNLVIRVDDSDAAERMRALRQELEDLVSHPKTVKVTTELQQQNLIGAQPVTPTASAPSGPFPFATNLLPRMFGAIAMATGGLRQISKPQSADIYAGRGAGTIFAEQETGGEAYIPLAPSKRTRSTAILREVARRFGITSFAEGGITVDELKAMASGIEGQTYGWGAPAGPNSDCSGAQSWIANMISGGTGRFATISESSALAVRGFQMGDPPPGVAAYWVGWKNGGPGGGHTAGTIVDPEGGNVNVEMGGKRGNGQFGGGAAGARDFPSRAWIALAGGDNGKTTGGGGGASTSQVMSAQSSVRRTKAATAAAQKDLDDANAELNSAPDDKKRAAAEKKRDGAQRRLDSAKDRQAVAEQKLSEVLDKKAKGTDKEAGGAGDAAGGGMGQGLGQGIISGLFQGLGIDGSVFSNPMEWPNVKSGMAALNWGLNYAQKWAGADNSDLPGGGGELNFGSEVAGGAMAGLGVNIPSAATTATQAPPRGGDTYNISGVNPTDMLNKVDARQMAAQRRNFGTVQK